MVKPKTMGWVLNRALAAGLVLALFAGSAAAETFSFDGRRLEIPIPPGFCKLEEGGPDAALRKAIAPDLSPELRLLVAVIECDALTALRKDPAYSGPVSFGSVVLTLKDGKPAPIKNTRRDLFAGQAGLAPERHEVRKHVEAWMRAESHPNVTARKEVGIADIDLNGMYFLVTVTARGRTKPALVVQTMSTTIVNGMGVTVAMNDPVSSRTSLPGILAEQKRNLAALVAANDS